MEEALKGAGGWGGAQLFGWVQIRTSTNSQPGPLTTSISWNTWDQGSGCTQQEDAWKTGNKLTWALKGPERDIVPGLRQASHNVLIMILVGLPGADTQHHCIGTEAGSKRFV